ncbi:MAG: PQQ-binding-like beta-propeller repeat protein [Chitinophagaceae bacterium]|nr:PQQ-binding-like beta-propeller repeat protein [Chitinophagaceae bacterium]
MKTKFSKVFWLIIPLLAINACKKDKDVPPPDIPEQNKAAFISDYSNRLYAANAQTGLNLWTYATNISYNYIYASPAVNKSTVVFADYENHTVYSFNAATGALNWERTPVDLAWLCSPIIVNDIVYVGSYNKLLGLKLSDGTTATETELYSSLNTLNYSNGLLIAGTCGGHLYGIDLSGNIKWEYLSNSSCYHFNAAINNKTVYILSSGAKLSAVNITNGAEIWSTMINEYTDNASVVYNNGMLFIAGDYDNRIFAFDAANGLLKHSYIMPTDQYVNGYMAPAILDGVVYMTSEEGTLFAFNIANETIKWQKVLDLGGKTHQRIPVKLDGRTEDYAYLASVTIANDVIFTGAGRYLNAFDKNGNLKWQMATIDDINCSSPVILSDKDKVYRGGNAGVVE